MLETRNFVVRTLIADGLLTESDLRRATEHSLASGGDVLESLVKLQLVNGRRLAIAKAKICEYPFVDLAHYDIDFKLSRHLPRGLAERLGVFPIFIMDGVATVAMIDPLNLQAIDQVRQHLRCDIDPVQADTDQLRTLITRAYSLATADDQNDATQSGEQTLTTGDEPVVAAVNQILAGAVDALASDVHINPDEGALLLRYRVDGVLLPQQAPSRTMHDSIVQRLKVLAKLDLTQTRKPQDGKFRYRHGGESVDIRLSIIPTVHGENVVMRLLRSASRLGSIESLGMGQPMTGWFEEIIRRPHGIVLVTGPTGSGKTTTLYTALNALNAPDVNIMTIEDPVEIRLPMIRQVQVNHDIGLTFASALRSMLRQDPDVILVGEIRDDETARIAVQSAMTGHLVLSTLHTNDSVGAVDRLRHMGLPSYAIGSALTCSISQRLVRCLCPHCQKPESEAFLLSRVPEHMRATPFYTSAGCDQCRHAGYTGRTAVFEMLRVTPRVQMLIEHNSPASEVVDAALADGFLSLFDAGLCLAARGRTSLSEVIGFAAQFADNAADAPAGVASTAHREAA